MKRHIMQAVLFNNDSLLILADDFTEADSTLITSHTMNKGPGWTVIGENVPDIQYGNLHGIAAFTNYTIQCDSGISDNIHAVFSFGVGGARQVHFLFRMSDDTNYWQIIATGTLLRLNKVVDNSATTVVSWTVTDYGTNMHRMSVDVVGQSVSISIDSGEANVQALDSFNQTATRIGLLVRADAIIDNFRLYNTAQPAYVGYGDTLQEAWRSADADTFSLQDRTGVTNPILTKAHVTDVADMDAAGSFVADPFIVKNGNTWVLFYEAYNGAAQNVYSTSLDLATWTYGAYLKLDGSIMLASYPFVFMVDGEWWMIHSNDRGVELWKSSSFPREWVTHEVIVYNFSRIFRDVSIFQWGGYFWFIVYDHNTDNCHLYYSEKLRGGKYWTEHPSSPILTGVRNSRPGGRPIIHAGGIDVLVQDSVTVYGNKLRAYRISALDTTSITIAEKAESPLLDGDGSGWNATGMHHLDRVDDTLSIVDGKEGDVWSIGYYEDVP